VYIILVLFIADAKVQYNDYKQCVTVNINSKTIVTVDPAIPATQALRKYIETVPRHAVDLLDAICDSVDDGMFIKKHRKAQKSKTHREEP